MQKSSFASATVLTKYLKDVAPQMGRSIVAGVRGEI